MTLTKKRLVTAVGPGDKQGAGGNIPLLPPSPGLSVRLEYGIIPKYTTVLTLVVNQWPAPFANRLTNL